MKKYDIVSISQGSIDIFGVIIEIKEPVINEDNEDYGLCTDGKDYRVLTHRKVIGMTGGSAYEQPFERYLTPSQHSRIKKMNYTDESFKVSTMLYRAEFVDTGKNLLEMSSVDLILNLY